MKFLGDLFGKIKPTYDDNSVDRLNYWWTCLITVFLSLMIGSFQFGGNPITCWSPKEFTDSWDQYLKDYCFVENTYFLSFNHTQIPAQIKFRKDAEIQYYQWIPFILAFQALLFYLPHVIWNSVNHQSGINVQKIVSMATDTKNIDYENRKENVAMIGRHIEQSLQLQQDFGSKGNTLSLLFFRFGKQHGIYVTLCYIAVKVLFVANVIGQFFMINYFLNPGYTFWGPQILSDIVNGKEWESSGQFPRVTFCDFEIRRLGAIQRYTVQCVIWINMLNEKIYLFLWFWMLLVAILSILDMFYWLFVSLMPGYNKGFIKRYLRVRGKYDPNLKNQKIAVYRRHNNDGLDSFKELRKLDVLTYFVKRHLRRDGLFVLRLMSSNCGDLITTDIVEQMWDRFVERQKVSIERSSAPLPIKGKKQMPTDFVASDQEVFHPGAPRYAQFMSTPPQFRVTENPLAVMPDYEQRDTLPADGYATPGHYVNVGQDMPDGAEQAILSESYDVSPRSGHSSGDRQDNK